MVNVKNIYWMLAYAFKFLNEKGTQSIKTEEFENIYDLYSAILIKGINGQLRRGLNREYIVNREELENLKGKIEITESIKCNTMLRHKMICEYDEFSINSYMNRIIKTTLIELLEKKNIKREYQIGIKRILCFFEEIEQIDKNEIKWNSLIYDRNTITYKMLMNVCYLVLKKKLLTEEEGTERLITFENNKELKKLYEDFVKEYYRRHFPTLDAKSKIIRWNTEKEDKNLPIMKTDITLTYKVKNRIAIIDTKCYDNIWEYNELYNSKTISSKNLYQMFAYVKNKDKENTGNVQGIILYAKTDEKEDVNITCMMGKNKIQIRTLDLTDKFKNVAQTLDDIAYELTNNELEKVGL